MKYGGRKGGPSRQVVLIPLLFLLAIAIVILTPAGVSADELYLRDGRILKVADTWESGDLIWYRLGPVISSVTRSEVVRRVTVAAEPRPSTTAPTNSERAKSGKSARLSGEDTSARVTMIRLRDGTMIEVDSVREEAQNLVYRMGGIVGYIDRGEVVQVEPLRQVSSRRGTDGAGPASYDQRGFTTGHHGLDELIVSTAGRYELDPLLIYLVMREESGFNHRAVSRVGARGLMQLMPATARRLGIRNIHNPIENVDGGTRYLRQLIERFDGDVNLALAAYNAGEEAVVRYGRRIPPYRETRNYVWRINTAYRRYTLKTIVD